MLPATNTISNKYRVIYWLHRPLFLLKMFPSNGTSLLTPITYFVTDNIKSKYGLGPEFLGNIEGNYGRMLIS